MGAAPAYATLALPFILSPPLIPLPPYKMIAAASSEAGGAYRTCKTGKRARRFQE